MKRHLFDKPVLRDLFWFVVLPFQLKQWMTAIAAQGKGGAE